MTGFQNTVNRQQAPAVAGDFASANPRASVLAGEGAFVAGLAGAIVGRFAWIGDDGITVLNVGSADRAPDGFIHRDMQGLITEYLGESSMRIPEGFAVTLFNEGDFWATVTGSTAATYNAAVYANFATGEITIGSAATGASATGSIGSTNTGSLGSTNTAALGATFTATGTGTSFVVTSVTGLISIGDEIDGTGVTAGTTIVGQVSGTTGGAGTYTTSAATTSAADTITCFGSTIVTSVTTGLISIGDVLNGGVGYPVGATIATQVSGTAGGAGVYTLSAPGTAYAASGTGVTTFGSTMRTTVTTGLISVGDTVSGGAGFPVAATVTAQVSGTAGGAGVYT
ncbi:MAG: structural cement protein Gp24, partial [Burkholderiales bacterium]